MSEKSICRRVRRTLAAARPPRADDPDCFRIAPEDESAITASDVMQKLDNGYVLGGFVEGELVGIAGLTALPGAKAKHKALLWGMYVREEARASGVHILNKPVKPASLRVLITQWRVQRVAAE